MFVVPSLLLVLYVEEKLFITKCCSILTRS